jgi:hypothetical protein
MGGMDADTVLVGCEWGIQQNLVGENLLVTGIEAGLSIRVWGEALEMFGCHACAFTKCILHGGAELPDPESQSG